MNLDDCVFCRIASGAIRGLRVYEDEKTLALMDIAGDVDGHILVIPKQHCVDLTDCDPDTLNAVMQTVRTVARHLTADCGYDGINLLHASGKSAGQSVPHFHIHMIPRRIADGIDAWPAFTGAARDLRSVYEEVRMTEDPPRS